MWKGTVLPWHYLVEKNYISGPMWMSTPRQRWSIYKKRKRFAIRYRVFLAHFFTHDPHRSRFYWYFFPLNKQLLVLRSFPSSWGECVVQLFSFLFIGSYMRMFFLYNSIGLLIFEVGLCAVSSVFPPRFAQLIFFFFRCSWSCFMIYLFVVVFSIFCVMYFLFVFIQYHVSSYISFLFISLLCLAIYFHCFSL